MLQDKEKKDEDIRLETKSILLEEIKKKREWSNLKRKD